MIFAVPDFLGGITEVANSFSIHTQNGGSFGQYVSVPEKLIEQYEARLREKEETIAFLRGKVK